MKVKPFSWGIIVVVSGAAFFTGFLSYRLLLTPTLNVPSKPLPSPSSKAAIPDHEFINVSALVISFLNTHNHSMAPSELPTRCSMFHGPIVQTCQAGSLRSDLGLESSDRIVPANPMDLKIQRRQQQNQVVVDYPCEVLPTGQSVATSQAANLKLEFTTIPRNKANRYGIVVVGLQMNKEDRR